MDHDILLYKLKLYHFSQQAILLLKSYLSNRQQFVKVGNIRSSKLTIKSGVPQGSILGPLLFILYINDISLHLQNSSIDLYADDSTLYAYGDSNREIESKIQTNISSVLNWCSTNNMALHPGKTKCMLLGSPHKLKHINELSIYINDIKIENVSVQRLLGVYIDQNLTWDVQINSVCNRLKSKLSLLKRLSHFLNEEMKTLFYNSYIMSTFDYCCTVWAKNKQSHIQKITTLQKRAGKIILQKPMRTPSSEIFERLKWLTFENRIKYHAGILVFKILNNQSPEYMKDLISFSNNDNYNLRSSSKKDIAQIRFKTQYMKRSFGYFSRSFWNTLPTEIRSALTVQSFKSNSKKYLLNTQS